MQCRHPSFLTAFLFPLLPPVAYEVLSDPDKRRQYDMFGSHDDSSGGRGGGRGFPNFHSTFDYDTFFGRNRQGSGRRSSSDHTFSFTFDDLFGGNPFEGHGFGDVFGDFFDDDSGFDEEDGGDFFGFHGHGNMHESVYENEAPFGFGDIHYRQSSHSFRGAGECSLDHQGAGPVVVL